MRELFILVAHLLTTLAKLMRPGGVRAVAAELMQRLAALVPRPRLHLIRFHGVLAPHAKLRAAILVPSAQQATEHRADHAHAPGSPERMSWACLAPNACSISILNTAR